MKRPVENSIIHADPARCVGCHSCELACGVAHSGGGLHDVAQGAARGHPRMRVVSVGGATMPVQCRQCEDAPCAHACPTGAIRQSDGRVDLRQQHCIGCKLCVLVCPFGAITVKAVADAREGDRTNRGVALKCDLCAGTGREGPACVEACPTKAIQLVDLAAYREALMLARVRELAVFQPNLMPRSPKP